MKTDFSMREVRTSPWLWWLIGVLGWTYPPPFPNGKGAGWLMVVTIPFLWWWKVVLHGWGRTFMAITDENGFFDAWGYALTLIEMIDRRVGLSLSRGERVWWWFLFCGDEELGCMVERELLRWRLMKTVFSMRGVMTSPLRQAQCIAWLWRLIGVSVCPSSIGRGYCDEFFSVVMKSWVAWLREIMPPPPHGRERPRYSYEADFQSASPLERTL